MSGRRKVMSTAAIAIKVEMKQCGFLQGSSGGWDSSTSALSNVSTLGVSELI